MAIPEKDIKLLWGRSAGRCSYCNENLTIELADGKNITIGEMAHIIAKRENGPRGSENIPNELLNTYHNLILLCNNHHEMIDKSPQSFTVEEILGWKKAHEERIEKSLEGELFNHKEEMLDELKRILLENENIFYQYGPESFVARRNPLSDAKYVWDASKTSTLIPNNQRIINIIERNKELLTIEEYSLYLKFKAHAQSFESNNYERMDNESVLTFPGEFKEMIFNGGNKDGKE